MPLFRTLSALAICTSLSFAGEPVKLRTLAGKVEEGDLVSITDKEITLQGKEGPIKMPLTVALDLMLPYEASLPSDNYSDIELTDGSLFHCLQFALKGTTLECKLADGRSMKLRLMSVASVLNDAQNAKIRDEWKGILARKGNLDQLAVKDSEGKLNVVEGTLGSGDDKGTSIEFETGSGVKRRVNLGRVQAMGFVRKSNPDAPAATCKIMDTSRNTWMAAKLNFKDGHFTIVTAAAGTPIDCPQQVVSRIDYSQGKVAYLSDLDPVKTTETSNVEAIEHYRRDRNLDNGPLQLMTTLEGRTEAQTFAKGLAIHATTEMVYEIAGQYKELKGLVGVDPGVGGDSQVRVVIEGDGRELFAADVRRGDEVLKLACDLKNVRQLRITVRPVGFLDLGNHVNLADARLVK
jgi:NPCBM/NEW2 domain